MSELSKGFKRQAHLLSTFPGGLTSPAGFDVPIFFTYHPAILLPGRKPALIVPVSDHFRLLQRFLIGEFIPSSLHITPQYGAPVPSVLPKLVAIDIETYGILAGVNQTVFHPIKSLLVDGVPLSEQIISISFGFTLTTEANDTVYQTFVYDFQQHKYLIHRWFRSLVSNGSTILGQNTKFDIQYLRLCDPVLATILDPTRIRLDDTLLGSFLLFEQRPEKGLKELATLFGLTDYTLSSVTGRLGNAKSRTDPALIYYNALDVACTLALYSYTWSQVAKVYGQNSSKMSTLCAEMRNQILWDVIMLESSGIAFSVPELKALHARHTALAAQHTAVALSHGVKVGGVGSEKSCRSFMTEALTELGLLNDSRVQLTEKARKISVGQENFGLILSCSGPSYAHWDTLNALIGYHTSAKVLNTYTGKLLDTPSVGLVRRYNSLGIAYPAWYPIPANIAKGGPQPGTTLGGTIQGRFSCKTPAAQTFPPDVKRCMTTRYAGGFLSEFDLSQIELRGGALLSGDPIMIDEYRRGIDRHTQTALVIWPDADPLAPDFKTTKRQGGKTLNFLVLYRGGALKFQETLLKDHNIYIELEKCQAAIDLFNTRYHHFREWQDRNIDTVKRLGYLELPTGWSRNWGKGLGGLVDSISEICDFPIQTIAAQTLQNAHFMIECKRQALHLKSKVVCQIHDSLYVDGPPDEEKIMDEIVGFYLTNPPLWTILCNTLGRTVPLLYEKKKLR